MVDIERSLTILQQHIQSNEWARAEQIGLTILKHQPACISALEGVGMSQCYLGKWQDAIATYKTLISLKPNHADAHNNIAVALKETEQWQDSIHHYQQAIAINPLNAGAYSNLGNLLQAQGEWREAIAQYRRAIALQPDFADAYDGIATTFQLQGNWQEAIGYHQQAIAHAAQNARLLYNQGNTYRLNQQYDEAIRSYRQAIALQSNYPEAYSNLGLTFQQQGNLEAALHQYQQAARLRPDYPENYNNIGSIYRVQGQLEEAIAHYEQAIALKPNYAESLNNLGLCRYALGQFEQSEAAYRSAIALQPTYTEAHFNLSLLLLLLGDLPQGFLEYEWRWKQDFYPPRSLPQPMWNGSSLSGKTLLLFAEQGFGDTIQFVRFASQLANQAERVIVECQEPLVDLLKTIPGIAEVIPRGKPLPAFDVYAPLMSVPRLLNLTVDTIPAPIPYLTAAVSPSFRRSPVQRPDRLRVGIVWAGNPDNPNDRRRSTRLEDWLPILTLSNVEFFSLQKGERAAELGNLDVNISMVDWSDRLQNFADTAAAIAQLDLVITVDTAVAHLAGAMGKPTWVLLSYVPDWRWLLHRHDSPWYPTVRLFRQTDRGNWSQVANDVAIALAQLSSTPSFPAMTSNSPLTVTEALNQIRQLYRSRQFTEARRLCDLVLQTKPKHPAALNLRGLIEEEFGNYASAMQHYEQAIAAKPDFAEAYNNMGNALQRSGQYEQSVQWYERAIELNSNYAQAYSNLGAALQELGRFDECVATYQQAIALKPEYPEAYYNLGNAYRNQGNFAAAQEAYQRAIAIRPSHAEAYNNMGLGLFDEGKPTEAVEAYNQAIAVRSDYADAYLNRSLCHLLLGDFEQGFRDYEWRWKVKSKGFRAPRNCPQPLWNGSDLNGKTILLHSEQGFGDTIQFIRYAALVAAKGGQVIAEVQAPLKRLVATVPGVHQAIAVGEPMPPFDVHAPLLSLPYLLKTTPETIPAAIPYFSLADAPKPIHELGWQSSSTESPQQESPQQESPKRESPKLKVGFVWAGSPTHRSDRYRSLRLEDLRPLFEIPQIAFYSLQKGPQVEAELKPLLPHLKSVQDLSEQFNDFADTATAIAQLDLVITVDTSVGHLAAALGKPVWTMLSYAPDWRWLLDRTDSPWYPSVRLFRQNTLGDWTGVIERVQDALVSLRDASPVPAAIDSTAKAIGIGFPIGIDTGWRVYGLNLTLQLLKRQDVDPIPLMPVANPASLNPIHRSLILPLMGQQQRIQKLLSDYPNQAITGDFLVLRGLGNNMTTTDENRRILGRRNVGVIFSEDTHFQPEAIAEAKRFDRIVAGSRWNAEVLQGYGLENVVAVQQGIDPTLFHPAPKSGVLGDRFVIFSGGKLEYRKGQDLVVAAFRAFYARHPEALLLTAWHNIWPRTMAGIDRAGYVSGMPQVEAGRLLLTNWLVQNGIPSTAVMDVGAIPNYMAGAIVREADVALFPNRAEGGTNLVAMECLACGLPTILSANTGHLDLLGDHCYALNQQSAVQPIELFRGTEGWGESDVEEIVARLEDVYGDRATAQQKRIAAAEYMKNWTWDLQTTRFLQAIDL